MSVAIKSTEMSYKDPNSGNYVGINVVSEKKTSQQISSIVAAGASERSAIEAKGQTVISDIPASYDDLNNIIAGSYDSTKTYSVGAYVRYYDGTHDNLYRCITDISTPEVWTSSHWNKVVIANEVRDLNRNLSITTRNLFPYKKITGTKYGYIYLNIPRGTYTVSADVTSSDTHASTSMITFCSGSISNEIGVVRLERNVRSSAQVTLASDCDMVVFYASSSSSESTGDTFAYDNIQLEIGSFLTDYVKHDTANDTYSREKIANNTVIRKKIVGKISGTFPTYYSPDYIPTVKKNERYYFNCNITTLGTIAFGLYKTSLSDLLNHVTVDSTNLTVYDDDGTSNVYAHGLTIAHNLTILIENDSAYNAVITLISDGEIFKKTGVPWNRKYYGRLYARKLNGADISNVTMGWLCKDINKDIWMFGDSYFSWTDRWFYYFHQYGYDNNVLMDAYSGEGSVDSLASLYKLLSISTPKCIVWCLGMNDGSDSGAPSATWLNNITKVTDVCKKLGISLVLATIPTVPTVNNEYKNTWVKASGYRYIDFANAVGSQADGTWFSGMLSNDGIHPTAKGAKALFAQVIADLPEVMITDD